MISISAGLTFFHGELPAVQSTLQRLTGHVSHIFVYANSSLAELSKLSAQFQNVVVLGSGKNIGLSRALNSLVEASREAQSNAVLLLDQDTVIDDLFVHSLSRANNLINRERSIAAIFPQLQPPEGYKKQRVFVEDEINIQSSMYLSVPFAPLSAGIYQVELLSRVPFSERLFVDLIDVYWGLTVRKEGYKLLIDTDLNLIHTIGNGILGRGALKIPLQADSRYIDYVSASQHIAADRAIPIRWRFLILIQAFKIILVRIIFGQNRRIFIRQLFGINN
jgi:GT2 family glycosyltransferase